MTSILLVEDDFALAMGTEYALQAEGYEVIHVSNLMQARKELERNPDLILLDVMLPDGNGFDFCKEVRENNRHVPIIFLTAVEDEINILIDLKSGEESALAWGCDLTYDYVKINGEKVKNRTKRRETVQFWKTSIFYS